MQEICGIEVFIELSPMDGLVSRPIDVYKFQTKGISFSTLVRVVSNIFNEMPDIALVTDSYMSMRQCIFATLAFRKIACVKIQHLKHQTEFSETITDVKALQRSLRKIYCNIMTQKYMVRDDYLKYFFLSLRDIIENMRRDVKNNHIYINKYVANIKTIDYIKTCDVPDMDSCVDYYYMEKTKTTQEAQKFKLYREFLSIRKNRREEIGYYIAEKERCEKKKIIC